MFVILILISKIAFNTIFIASNFYIHAFSFYTIQNHSQTVQFAYNNQYEW